MADFNNAMAPELFQPLEDTNARYNLNVKGNVDFVDLNAVVLFRGCPSRR